MLVVDDKEINKSKSVDRSIAVPLALGPDNLVSHKQFPAQLVINLLSGTITFCSVTLSICNGNAWRLITFKTYSFPVTLGYPYNNSLFPLICIIVPRYYVPFPSLYLFYPAHVISIYTNKALKLYLGEPTLLSAVTPPLMMSPGSLMMSSTSFVVFLCKNL